LKGENHYNGKTFIGKAWVKNLPCKLVYENDYDYRNYQVVEAMDNYQAELVELCHDIANSRQCVAFRRLTHAAIIQTIGFRASTPGRTMLFIISQEHS